MNHGASQASGDVLLFLHADTRLPSGYERWVHTALDRPRTVAGAFSLQIDARDLLLRGVERAVAFRSRFLRLPYGDQALFVRRQVFDELGGFPDQPIMEDYEFVRRLRVRGRIRVVSASVLTSARRWQRLGVVKTTLLNQAFLAAYRGGLSPDWIARQYHRRHSSLTLED